MNVRVAKGDTVHVDRVKAVGVPRWIASLRVSVDIDPVHLDVPRVHNGYGPVWNIIDYTQD